jgi:antitoxin CptB
VIISVERKAKFKWHCRRGMLELDLMLARFFERYIDHLGSEQLNEFEKLLHYPDPDLYAWLMGYQEYNDHECSQIITFIRCHDHI